MQYVGVQTRHDMPTVSTAVVEVSDTQESKCRAMVGTETVLKRERVDVGNPNCCEWSTSEAVAGPCQFVHADFSEERGWWCLAFFLVGRARGAMVENAGSSAAPAWATRRVRNEIRSLRLCVGVNNGNCNMKRCTRIGKLTKQCSNLASCSTCIGCKRPGNREQDANASKNKQHK